MVDVRELLRGRVSRVSAAGQRGRARFLHRVLAHARQGPGVRERFQAGRDEGQPLAPLQVGALPGGLDADGGPYPVDEYRVSGAEPVVVEMAPGMTHSITNLSRTDDLVTLMWANEPFDPANPDTFYEEV